MNSFYKLLWFDNVMLISENTPPLDIWTSSFLKLSIECVRFLPKCWDTLLATLFFTILSYHVLRYSIVLCVYTVLSCVNAILSCMNLILSCINHIMFFRLFYHVFCLAVNVSCLYLSWSLLRNVLAKFGLNCVYHKLN